MEENAQQAKTDIKECEEQRHKHLVMIGNVLHSSVPISNDEVRICMASLQHTDTHQRRYNTATRSFNQYIPYHLVVIYDL